MIQPWLRLAVLAALFVGACRPGSGNPPDSPPGEATPAPDGPDPRVPPPGDEPTPEAPLGEGKATRRPAPRLPQVPEATGASGGAGGKAAPPGRPGTGDADRSAIVAAAVGLVAGEAGVGDAAVTVIDVTAVTWRDGSLGCPEPGRYYIQQIIDGYRILLSAAGQEYAVHTDHRPGGAMVICRGGGSTLE